MFEEYDLSNRRKNEWLLLSVSFTTKFGLVFVLTLENTCSQRFHFKDNRKSISSFFLKNGTIGFQNKPLLERSACFYVTITGNFERFRYFQFKTDFLENENFFQKTGVLFFQFKKLRLKTHHFHTKLPYQKPILR